jgi:hypothetical protein
MTPTPIASGDEFAALIAALPRTLRPIVEQYLVDDPDPGLPLARGTAHPPVLDARHMLIRANGGPVQDMRLRVLVVGVERMLATLPDRARYDAILGIIAVLAGTSGTPQRICPDDALHDAIRLDDPTRTDLIRLFLRGVEGIVRGTDARQDVIAAIMAVLARAYAGGAPAQGIADPSRLRMTFANLARKYFRGFADGGEERI